MGIPGRRGHVSPLPFVSAREGKRAEAIDMTVITDEQRRTLVEHALECNRHDASGQPAGEQRFADVIADLAMDRVVSDRALLVSFLWQRISLAVEAGVAREDHWAWSAAVEVLDGLGEDLGDIFRGRPAERVLVLRWSQAR
jgi:hypothetical protein